MDTSKDYYESVMRQFKTYGRGRTLEQFCRDEGADFKWIEKAAGLYGTPEKEKGSKAVRKTRSKSLDMIQLHFEPEPGVTSATEPTKIITEDNIPSTETNPAEFTVTTAFRDLDEWSSLTALSIIAMVDEEYDVTIKGDEIRNANTVEDLFNTVMAKKN